jgi:hypothetical protein
MSQLAARRRVLLARCELQRAEMAVRVGELKNDPLRRVLVGALGGSSVGHGRTPLKHPLTWVVAIAGLFFLRRPRQVLTVLGWARTALEMAGKASLAMRVIGQVRSTFARAPRRAPRAESPKG